MPDTIPAPRRTSPSFAQRNWVGRNFLVGIRHAEWQRLCAENEIDGSFRGRAAVLGLLSRFNSMMARREEERYGAAIAATEIKHPPVFLLGFWRSGTTHLHQLLGRDPRFGYVSTLQAIHPSTSLVSAGVFGRRGTRQRPMDGVQVGSGTPQEDEFAIASRSLASPFLGYVFPRRSAYYDKYLTFDEAGPEEIARWKDALLWTMKKATYLSGGRQLILKSPPHTARVRRLQELFPKAKFVHLHRHPVDVLRSHLSLDESIGWNSYLQIPAHDALAEAALRRYGLMFNALFRDVPAIPRGQYFETSYKELTARPLDVLEAMYGALGLPDFGEVRPGLAAYFAAQPAYVRQEKAPLAAGMQERILDVAGESMARWGYK